MEFLNKTLFFNERNIPLVKVSTGEEFGVEVLSSGEKQLFILLGEVLLQEGAPNLFLADEPELSLHVQWQSNLVQNMRSLNSDMQIIFATHSPDIVSVYSPNVIDAAKVIA
jgi:predicted ATPase